MTIEMLTDATELVASSNSARVSPLDSSQHASAPLVESHKLPRATEHLELPRLLFRLVWLGVVVVSLLNGLLTGTYALIYYAAMIIRGGYMIESSGLIALETIPIVVASYAVLSVVFLRFVIVPSGPRRGGVFRIGRRVRRVWCRLFAEGGPFEVSLETFVLVFLVREVIEVTTQSYQAYKCSTLISADWILNFYVGTLALNCWISPIIHACTHRNPALQRFLYLCSDVVLDFAATFVVPIVIIVSVVVPAFTANTADTTAGLEFAFDAPVGDIGFVTGVRAIQQIFVVSWVDFITKLLPFVSMASCVGQIRRHVQPPSSRDDKLSGGSSRSVAFLASAAALTHRLRASVVGFGVSKSIAVMSRFRRRLRWICRSRVVKTLVSVSFAHSLFFAWGVAIVVVHLNAKLIGQSATLEHQIGCKLTSRPWLVSKFTCTILEVNCYRHEFVGRAEEIASALTGVDSQGVSSLIISHCPLLEIPRELQDLSGLFGLEFTNCTFVRWGEEAALAYDKLPILQYMSLFRVNMSELPMGLQSSRFPPKVRDIWISVSNLTTLPPDLHTKWRRLLNLFVERTLIEELPTTISQMDPSRLSLFGNRIKRVPEGFFANYHGFQVVSFAKNPIAEWPSTLGSLQDLYLVLVDYTEISDFPSWQINEGERRSAAKTAPLTISAGGSSYCNRQSSDQPVVLPGLYVVCRPKTDEEIQACPLSFNLQIRKP